MPVRFGQQTTPGGYNKAEVASALQKEIRRGHEQEALFWATELELAGNGEYVWKRLKIIASEDVGLADNQATILVRALYDHWLKVKPTTTGEAAKYASFHRVFIAHAVIYLARAPKSRMLDHALMTMYEGTRKQPEIPEYALDKHTAAGKRLGHGKQHFVDVGSHLENEGDVDDPYRAEGIARFLNGGG